MKGKTGLMSCVTQAQGDPKTPDAHADLRRALEFTVTATKPGAA